MTTTTMRARQLLARLREGQYQLPNGQAVQFTDGETLKALQDLYRVTPETNETGSSHLANDQVRGMLTDVLAGQPLTGVQFGQLHAVLKRYATELAALRAAGNVDGQDYGAVPDPATGRLVGPASQRDHHGRFTGAVRS